MSDPLPLEWDCASCLALRAEIERHIREKVELAGLVAKERARIERLEAALKEIARDGVGQAAIARAALAGKEG